MCVCVEMASTRSRREIHAKSPNPSDVEDPGSDSDYSPGSLMIDMGAEDIDRLSSAPSSPPPVIQPSPIIATHPNKGRRSIARRQYNTESNRMVFTGVSLLGQMKVIQSGHTQPLDRLDLYAYGWGDFFLDIISRRSNCLIPVKNIYEKVIPGLKRNVLSARISKLQVKSEALSEPYISAMKKLGLVVTGASHFVGVVDFIKICRYFHVQPPHNLTKFYAINSEVNPEDVLRSFSAEQNEIQSQSVRPQDGSSGGGGVVSQASGVGGDGVMSLLSAGGGMQVKRSRKGDMDARPGSHGSGMGPEISSSPHNTPQGVVDIRRLVLGGGASVSVVVRAGEPYLLKVELPAILPAHSRDVLETIRRTYGITVQHASKSEISILKNKGVVGGKAGRCALFTARDVCRMFRHWNTVAPQPFRDLADGKLPSEKLESSDPALPPYSLPPYTSFPVNEPPLPSFPTIDIPSLPPSSSSFTSSVASLDLSPFGSTQPNTSQHHTPTDHQFYTPRLSHPPTVTSSHFPISSLSADQFQQPIQMLNSIQSSTTSSLPPPLPPFSTSSHPSFSTSSHPPFSTSSHPPSSHLPFSTPTIPSSRVPQANFGRSERGMPPPISANYTGFHPTNALTGEGMGKSPVISGINYPSASGIKVEDGSGGRRRSSSISGPPLDDQDLDYARMRWGECEVTLLCPPAGAEPFIAIPELVDKVFHNRAYVSVQRRNELGIITLPATSLQMHVLRAKGSLDAFTGNIKLVSLSGAVKLAAVSNIQIPGTVIQMIRKYCKEPLESIITPAGFAPATCPPSSQPSQISQPSHPQHLSSHTSQYSRSHHSLLAHSESPMQELESSYSAGGGKTFPQSDKKRASPMKQVVTSSNDESAASVSPLEGVPQHPDLIDPGPNFTNTGDGTYCLVKWGAERLVLLIGSQRVHYMGLYQVFQTLFKQYVTRMNFKMRMRKLEIKSIRAASSVRQALINLDALPQSSPVCGLIRVSEVERLARSYGVEPPQVLYDVFLLRHSDQKQLPNYSRSGVAGVGGGGKGGVQKPTGSPLGALLQSGQGPRGYQEGLGTHVPMPGSSHLGTTGYQHSQFGQSLLYGTPQSSSPSSLPPTSHLHSTVITTAASDKNALMVSVPRQLLTSRFRLVSRPVAPPGVMAGFHSSSRSSYPPPHSRGSMLHNLAKKISQKSRKLGKGKTSGVGAVRCCPNCHYVNPPSKKRCQRCEEFMVGRTCPECGTLNHNRTRECFRCNAVIASDDGHPSPPDDEAVRYRRSQSEGEGSLSPEYPLSSHFSPPPIRNAALKSMFPQNAGKSEDSGVVTKTMFSGNLASSRKCLECGQLNSKMAKKCLQCKSPLQGRPCPWCNRPNHSHSTECYKCGHSLPCTATKWVYVGSNSSKIYRSQDSNTSSRLSAGLKNRAPTVCLRCDRLRTSGQFTCGRCGDIYWTKPVVGGVDQTDNAANNSHSKKKKAALEPNWNTPSEPDSEELVSFANNLLCLGLGEGLLSLVNDAETKARETVHQAEEELEVIEEEYQVCARKREEKESILNDARVELEALIADMERHTQRLSQLDKEEEEAKSVTLSHPGTVNGLRERVECVLGLFTPPSTSTDEHPPTEEVAHEEVESMDTTAH